MLYAHPKFNQSTALTWRIAYIPCYALSFTRIMEQDLEDKLVVGTKIKIGAKFSQEVCGFKEGEIIELVNGSFEEDNGLYTTMVDCPSVWDENVKDFDSIYHLFGNDLEDFLDCEIIS